MAGRKNRGTALRCDDFLKDGTACKQIVSEGESKCRTHLARANGNRVTPNGATLSKITAEEPEPEEFPEEAALEEAIERVHVSDIRGQLAEDIANDYYVIRDALLGGLKAERDMYVTCPKCSKRHPVPVADWNGRVNATKALLDQSLGKLKEATTVKMNEESLRAWYEEMKPRLRTVSDWTTEELRWYDLYYQLVEHPDNELFEDEAEISQILSEASESDAVHKLIAVVERAKLRASEREAAERKENTVRFPTRPVPSVGDSAA